MASRSARYPRFLQPVPRNRADTLGELLRLLAAAHEEAAACAGWILVEKDFDVLSIHGAGVRCPLDFYRDVLAWTLPDEVDLRTRSRAPEADAMAASEVTSTRDQYVRDPVLEQPPVYVHSPARAARASSSSLPGTKQKGDVVARPPGGDGALEVATKEHRHVDFTVESASRCGFYRGRR